MSDDVNKDNQKKLLKILATYGTGARTGSTAPAKGGLRLPPPPPQKPNPYLLRPVVNGLYYNNKVVNLDGYQFIGCRFDNCTLSVSTTDFEIIDCVIDPTTVFHYGAEPMKVIRLFNSRYKWAYEHWPKFVPIKNADGSITITSQSV